MKIKAKFHNVIELVSNVMEAYTTALFVADETGKHITLFCSQSLSKKIEEQCIIEQGDGIIGWVFKEQKNIVVSNFERSSKKIGFYSEEEDIKSLMAVFLPQKRGVLFVDSKRSYTFTEEKEKIFKQIATIISNLIVEQERADKNILLKRTLEAYFEIEIHIDQCRDIKEIIEYFSKCIGLNFFILFIPERSIYVCFLDKEKKEYVNSTIEKDIYSADGLIGWCIKNNKKLLSNRKINSDKNFIIHKEDGIKTDNILLLPLTLKKSENEKQVMGVAVFSKIDNFDEKMIKKIFWYNEEINILEKSAFKLVYLIQRNSNRLIC